MRMTVRVAGLLAAFALAVPPPAAAQDQALVQRGAELYAKGCIGCHGENGRGRVGTGPPIASGLVQGAGPPLTQAGAASADLYLTTGYMPLADPRQIPKRSEPEYTPEEIDALVAYVDSLGDGPPIPEVDPERGDIAVGQQAFSLHCAGCHQIVAEGGVVIDGVAPELSRSTPTQIAEAIRVGPYLMPRFGEGQIDQHELDSIARYVLYTKEPRDEGGWGIGHIGPIPEGFFAWLMAAVVLVIVARLIGKRIA